jgi:hypothetical protein
MERSFSKNLILIGILIAAAGIVYYYAQRDKSIVDLWHRNAYTVDSIYATVDEKRIAQRFSDSTLPNLQKTGLITSTHRHEWEMIIIVNGDVWNSRSPFFKESFLKELLAYSKVQGSSFTTSVVDRESRHVYAKVIPPDHTVIYDE